MPRFIWVAAPFFLFVSQAQAEIFKCTARDGAVLYQNFKCEVDSLGSLPSTPTKAAPTDSKPLKPASVSVASVDRPAEPRVGMSADEVRAIWGEPTDTFNEEPGDGGRTETWAYGSDRSVRFDHKSRVIAVTKQGS
jgi:hypothetical protein